MSAAPAIELRGLTALLSPAAGEARGFTVDVSRLAVRVHQETLRTLARGRPLPVTLNEIRLDAGGFVAEFSYTIVPGELRINACRTVEGLLRVEVVSVKALGFFKLPGGLISGLLAKAQGKPGVVRVSGTAVDFDLDAVLRHVGAPVTAFPPLAAVRHAEGWLDLVWEAGD